MSEAEEENKALVRKLFEEVWNRGSTVAVDEFMTTDYIDHCIPSTGLPPGAEGLKQRITTYHTAFLDLQATVEDIFAEGEMVVFRWSIRGTHLGNG